MRKNGIASSKPANLFIASAFFAVVAYLFFNAASSMNYIWQWNAIPKYFVYEKENIITAPISGTLSLEDGKHYVVEDDSDYKEEVTLDASHELTIAVGEYIYKNDILASHSETAAGPILNGLWMTIKISFFAALICFCIGIVVAFMRLSKFLFLNYIASVYIYIVRGTPLLVQILLFYFIVANIFELSTFVAGVISLGVFFGAYMAEILRGAIQSIHQGQAEAGMSLNLSYFQRMRYIILPQAFRRSLPTLVGEMISLVKDSSLVSVISLTDLTKVGREIVANTFSPFETWICVAVVYLSITSLLTILGHYLEKRMKEQGGMG